MRQLLHVLFFSLFLTPLLRAQTGCPGCSIDLPPGLPADTVFLPPLPDGVRGEAYDETLSFRLPLTTTPVAAIDSTTPPGLPISKFEILGMDNLPPGLNWEPNQFIFETAVQTDGCVRICGTPTAADTFIITVRLKATVLFLTQETSFPLRLIIKPPVSVTDGFTMTNYTGCGETTVSFTNNIPSNGDPGFSYAWTFGDGTTFNGENPPPHTYSSPGMYAVTYHAIIDTVGYILQGFSVLGVDCNDPLGGAPDLYLRIRDPQGNVIYNTSPAINNTPLPWTEPIGLLLGNGNYTVEVTDEDSGIKGTDDPCGSVPFNVLSSDTLVSGAFRIVLFIERPLIEIFSMDTVTVYTQPQAPAVTAPEGLSTCAGGDSLLLVSSYGAGNQWFFNGDPIPDATAFVYLTEATGYYQVEVTTIDGCAAISDSVFVEYFPLPADPVITPLADLNGCTGVDSVWLRSSYANANQWYRNGMPINGAAGMDYAAIESGWYQVEYTSADGCTSRSDSVQVQFFSVPPAPVVVPLAGLTGCAGVDSVWLASSYTGGNQWYRNGMPIPGATNSTYAAVQSGWYQAEYTTPTGCSALSDSIQATFYPLPQEPAYTNTHNLLRLDDTTGLPAGYSLQWYLDGQALPDANGFTYCATTSGNYALEVTDPATGCSNQFDQFVLFDPAFDCTVSTGEIAAGRFRLYPNPAHAEAFLQLGRPLAQTAQVQVWDITGRLLQEYAMAAGAQVQRIDCGGLRSGIYLVELRSGDVRRTLRLTVAR